MSELRLRCVFLINFIEVELFKDILSLCKNGDGLVINEYV